MNRLIFLLLVLLAPAISSGCSDQRLTGTGPPRTPDVLTNGEEELFGTIYDPTTGLPTKDPNYTVTLEAVDLETQSHLPPDYWNTTMWVDTAKTSNQFGWFDAIATDGPCRPYTNLINGTVGPEQHRLRGQAQPPNTLESHCIVAGHYRLTLRRDGEIIDGREFLVDELQMENDGQGLQVIVQNDSAGGIQESLARNSFDASLVDAFGIGRYVDNIIHIDLSQPWASDAAVLQVDNALSDYQKRTFVAQHGITGRDVDNYRVSLSRSSSAWSYPRNDAAATHRALNRIFWDYDRNKGNSTGYFDAHALGGPVMRWHNYAGQISANGPVTIAIDQMRPDEHPNVQTPQAQELISMTAVSAPPVACAQFENLSTWLYSDQTFDASCSTSGADMLYSWLIDGFYTPESSSFMYGFSGHVAAGAQAITLKVRNTTTNEATTRTYSFNVASDSTILDGQRLVTVKSSYRYRSVNKQVFGWWESFDTARTWRATVTDSAIDRVWPAGKYAVELRQEDKQSGVLKRGRLHVEVCTTGGCVDPEQPLAVAMVTASAVPSQLFGIGPVVSWNGGAVRYYDLFGTPDVRSAFQTPAWLGTAGVQTAGMEGGQLTWTPLGHNYAGVEAQNLDISFPDSRLARFGIAVDFDIGSDASDDRSGYDEQGGMAYVFDDNGAAGILIRQEGTNAIRSVQQFGVRRLPPVSANEAAANQRNEKINLISGKSDVELLVSTAGFQRSASFSVVILQASTVGQLKALARSVGTAF